MAHNLYKNTMAYVGEQPWHKLGVQLKKEMTAEEAMKASSLDYEVQQSEVFFCTAEGKKISTPKKFEGLKINYNGDTKLPLAVVSDDYKILQNKEAFSFFDAVVSSGEAKYVTAGALGRGEKLWLLAKLPKDMLIANKDMVEKYLCLVNSHDGKSSLKVFFTPIRVVCQNTLTIAMKDVENGVSIRHIGDMKDKVSEARRVLGLAIEFYDEVEESFNAFVECKIETKKRLEIVTDLVGIKDEKDVSSQQTTARDSILQLTENGKGNAPYRGTAWALYNGVAEFADYKLTVRNAQKDPTNRTRSILFGYGAKMKQRAFVELKKLAHA